MGFILCLPTKLTPSFTSTSHRRRTVATSYVSLAPRFGALTVPCPWVPEALSTFVLSFCLFVMYINGLDNDICKRVEGVYTDMLKLFICRPHNFTGCSTTGVTKAVVCVILWDDAYKRTLAANCRE